MGISKKRGRAAAAGQQASDSCGRSQGLAEGRPLVCGVRGRNSRGRRTRGRLDVLDILKFSFHPDTELFLLAASTALDGREEPTCLPLT